MLLRFLYLFLMAGLLSGCQFFYSSAPQRPVASSLDKDTMKSRKELLSHIKYDLRFDLTSEEKFKGTSQIHFQMKKPSSLTLDFSGDKVLGLQVNGQSLSLDQHNGHFIDIPKKSLRQGMNSIEVEFVSRYSKNGTGLYRYKDSEDGSTYLYTHFEPYRANKVFPCFDQPNLRAQFLTEVKAPKDWVVVTSNREIDVLEQSQSRLWTFPQSEPFSTYLYSLHAGNYHVWESQAQSSGREIPLRLFARKSLAKYVQPQEWFDLTEKGFRFYEDFFSTPYAYDKYDQLIVPDFNSGAMENVGAVTFNEDRFVQRGPKTREDQRGLALTLLHELAHMWFGNLVTIEWWDDLWLKESFATHLSYEALARVTDFKEAWMVFSTRMKATAYELDHSVNTHAIVSEVHMTDEATANFDMITYGKGAALLRQLAYSLGESTYRKALANYFETHQHSSTQLQDFIDVMSEASAKDLSQWTERWLKTPMLNEVEVHYTCDSSHRIDLFELYQTGTKEHPMLRSHRTQVALFYKEPQGYQLWHKKDVNFAGERTAVPELIGKKCPDIVFPNFGDKAYFRVRFDNKSLRHIQENLIGLNDAFTRGLVWSELWQMVLNHRMNLEDYLQVVEFNGLNETHPHTLKNILAGVERVLTNYYPRQDLSWQKKHQVWVKFFEQSALTRLRQNFDDPALQNLWFEHLVQISESPQILESLANELNGRRALDLSFPLDQDQRWRVLARLVLYNHEEAPEMVEKELLRDPSQRGQLRKLYLGALNPDPESKRKHYEQLVTAQAQLSLAEQRTLMAGLFPRRQFEIHRQFAEDIYKNLKRVTQEAEPLFALNYSQHVVPSFCDEESGSRLNHFLKAEKGQMPFPVFKTLRQALYDNDRCLEMRRKMESTTASRNWSNP